jgi:hypothetical protein
MATITTVQYTDETQRAVRVTYDNGTQQTVPVAAGNRHWGEVSLWLAAGNEIAAAPPPPPNYAAIAGGQLRAILGQLNGRTIPLTALAEINPAITDTTARGTDLTTEEAIWNVLFPLFWASLEPWVDPATGEINVPQGDIPVRVQL